MPASTTVGPRGSPAFPVTWKGERILGVCVFLYMCVYMCICVCVCLYFMCVYACMHACIYVQICAYAYVCMWGVCVRKLQKKRFPFISPSILLCFFTLWPCLCHFVSATVPFLSPPVLKLTLQGCHSLGLSLCLPLGAPFTQHPVSLLA